MEKLFSDFIRFLFESYGFNVLLFFFWRKNHLEALYCFIVSLWFIIRMIFCSTCLLHIIVFGLVTYNTSFLYCIENWSRLYCYLEVISFWICDWFSNKEKKIHVAECSHVALNEYFLTHFMSLVLFYTPWTYQKTYGFQMFLRGTERDQRHKMK